MWRYYPDLLERPVPRYTSYPTALEFAPVDAEFHAAALAGLRPEDGLSLYVHIPYCDKICWYCGCNTGAANRRQRLTSYLDGLHSEINLVAGHLNGCGRVNRIAFGGGSPNAIDPVAFVRLLDRLLLAFNVREATLSVELDPRGLTEDWGRVLRRTGVTHASLGVQTLSDRLQQRIGRIQPVEQIERAVTMLRGSGIVSLNFDLMYGLPGQTTADLADTLDGAIELRPDRIALFGYAHLPARIPRQRQIDGSDLPTGEARFELAAMGHARLVEAGYMAVGFDHFALPGDPLAKASQDGHLHRNFQGFTEDANDHLIGLGASAISRIADRFVQNEKNSGRYRMRVSDGGLAGALGLHCSEDDRRRGAVIENLLCHGQADLGELAAIGNESPVLVQMRERGLVEISDRGLRISEDGRPYSRVIAHCFDRYGQSESEQPISSAL